MFSARSITTTVTSFTRRFGPLPVAGVGILIGALVALGIRALVTEAPTLPQETPTEREVSVAPARTLARSSDTRTVIGSVRARSEARLQTERSGRVTSVPVKLGDTVRPGAVIATLENATERAAVLQAEGVYESALAQASASVVGSDAAQAAAAEAERQARNTVQSAFASADAVLRNTVDLVYSQPDDPNPGLRIDGNGRATEFTRTRRALEVTYDTWHDEVYAPGELPLETALARAEANVSALSVHVGALIVLLGDDDALADAASLTTLRTQFAVARATLTGVLSSLSGAQSALIQAYAARDQAAIAGTAADVSLANAQVKQALGALRLAQANLAKTIIRSPIGGVVGSLSITEGTTVGIGTPAAVITYAGGLEIIASMSEADARLVTVGAPVRIEDSIAGVVTEVGTSIDPSTQKIELRIGVENDRTLVSGQTVLVSLDGSAPHDEASAPLRLPIVSIKMTPDGPVVFSVSDTMTLVAHPVTLGAIVGDTVVIESGITPDLRIVRDVRGLRAGETVTVR